MYANKPYKTDYFSGLVDLTKDDLATLNERHSMMLARIHFKVNNFGLYSLSMLHTSR